MPPSSTARHGFTLLELLIAMTLLGALAGLLYGGLRFGNRVWEQGGGEADRLDALLVAQTTLNRLLSGALAAPLADGDDDAPGRPFVGGATTLRFLSPAPAAAMPRGVYRIELSAEPAGSGADLVLAWRRAGDHAGDTPSADAASVGRAVLVAAAETVRFSYRGRGDGSAEGWLARWEDAGRLPALVRVEIAFAAGDRRTWPPLVAAPLVEEAPP